MDLSIELNGNQKTRYQKKKRKKKKKKKTLSSWRCDEREIILENGWI